jgi:hypothetical protein
MRNMTHDEILEAAGELASEVSGKLGTEDALSVLFIAQGLLTGVSSTGPFEKVWKIY